jgi:1-acyl-sn-glycerol-3-phosphate acyltransferase
VDRRAAAGLIGALVREMEARPWMWLAIAPEGTRARVPHLKSGFYRIALAAKVPVGLAFIDWRDRVVGLRDYLVPTGDEEADLARMRSAWEGKVGKRPALAAPIRLRGSRRA